MALNFPSSPSDGDVYDNFYWDAAAGIWRRQLTVTDLADLSVKPINDLDDVSASAPNDNDILVYDSGTSTWNAEAQPEVPPPVPVAFLLMGA